MRPLLNAACPGAIRSPDTSRHSPYRCARHIAFSSLELSIGNTSISSATWPVESGVTGAFRAETRSTEAVSTSGMNFSASLSKTLPQGRRGRHFPDPQSFFEIAVLPPVFNGIKITLANAKKPHITLDAVPMACPVTMGNSFQGLCNTRYASGQDPPMQTLHA